MQDKRTRSRYRIVTAMLAALLLTSTAVHAGVPLWQRVLRWVSGDTSDTPVQTHMMGKHMQMSVRQPPKPGDAERAEEIRAAARQVLATYSNVADAEAEGYAPFAPSGRMGEEVHYTHSFRAGNEKQQIDLTRPGSILYKRTPNGMQAVGVMYTAPGNSQPAELDKRVPLSIGVWHRHVHFCGWPSGTPRTDWDGPTARFGFAGSIGDEPTCKEAGGYWIPLALGWMTHIYPNETERDKIWIGAQMMMLNPAEVEHNAHGQKKEAQKH